MHQDCRLANYKLSEKKMEIFHLNTDVLNECCGVDALYSELHKIPNFPMKISNFIFSGAPKALSVIKAASNGSTQF